MNLEKNNHNSRAGRDAKDWRHMAHQRQGVADDGSLAPDLAPQLWCGFMEVRAIGVVP